jgi:excinuclease ABC subunit B
MPTRKDFLRSTRSLTQTAGRAARNINGRVIFYADKITDSMRRTMEETDRRRVKQMAYNAEHGITPTQIKRDRASMMQQTAVIDAGDGSGRKAYMWSPDPSDLAADPVLQYMTVDQLEQNAAQLELRMKTGRQGTRFHQRGRIAR